MEMPLRCSKEEERVVDERREEGVGRMEVMGDKAGGEEVKRVQL
jgi:hypothetical protein